MSAPEEPGFVLVALVLDLLPEQVEDALTYLKVMRRSFGEGHYGPYVVEDPHDVRLLRAFSEASMGIDASAASHPSNPELVAAARAAAGLAVRLNP